MRGTTREEDDARFFSKLSLKERFALVALAAMDGRGTSPKNVALKMVDLGFVTDKTSWMATMGKTLHELGTGGPGTPWGDKNLDPKDPRRPKYDWDTRDRPRNPYLVFYDGNRSLRPEGWSPFWLSVHGERWVAEHGAALIKPKQAEALGCPECGTSVVDAEKHASWHQRIADAVELRIERGNER